jgi:ketosteroid isomerase-like protein
VSQENVETVRAFQAGPDVDVAPLFRDDEKWAALSAGAALAFHPDFDCYARIFEGDWSDSGIDGFRNLYLKWLAPWETYRQDIEEVIDLGERVLVLPRDFARRQGSTHEVEIKTAVVFTFIDGKIARWEVYFDRDEGLKAVGLAE